MKDSTVKYRVELHGANEVLRRVQALTDRKKREQLLKRAIRAAGAVLLAEMRRRLKKHDRTGWLRKSMKSKLLYYKKTGIVTLLVGVASGRRTTVEVEKRLGKARKTVAANIVAHNYAHLVFGKRKAFTQQITYTTKTGRSVTMQRRIAAYSGDDIIREVVQTQGAAALAKMNAVITAGIVEYEL